jgi:glutamate formiminotransferase
LISDNNFKSGEVYIDNEMVKLEDLQKSSFIVRSNVIGMFFNITIEEDLKYYLGAYDNKKLEEYLNSFNLGFDVLNKSYMEIT